MTESLKSAFDFVKSAFPIRIGALSSNDAKDVCFKNNLSFTELIEPFCTLTNEVQIQGNGTQMYRVSNMHIRVADVHEQCLDIRDSSVQNLVADLIEASAFSDNQKMISLPYCDHSLSINRSCPWMDVYRDLLFRFGPPQRHEFLCHVVACMLVVSSSNSSPLQEFAELSQQQNRIQHGKNEEGKHGWMTPNTLKYYVLLHDVQSGDISKAREVYSSLQAMHGDSVCALLQINSRSTSPGGQCQDVPVPWQHFRNYSGGKRPPEKSQNEKGGGHSVSNSSTSRTMFGCRLTIADHNALQVFLQKFIISALQPYLEKVVKNVTDQLSARKTLHKSLFRATRTLFGSSKSTTTFGSSGYHHDANELLLRKAADLCFLMQMYDQAFSLYHAAKKEYTNDHAWLHAAGASEMAALSNFMQRSSQKSYPLHYMDSAILSYIDVCKNDYLALRSSLAHVECLQHLGLYQDAAFHLVKMTNESDDLRSALLLEQAAYCYIKMKQPLPKKFAFQLILAGHRFSKCGQKIHALRCYDVSLRIYHGNGWQLAEEHLNLAIARQCYNARQICRATEFFRKLLLRESCQSDVQQASILREFITAFQQSEELNSHGCLGLPEIKSNETEVIVQCDRLLSAGDMHEQSGKIAVLEDALLEAESLTHNQVIGAITSLSKSTLNTECPRVGVGETCILNFHLLNYLNTPLCLSDVKLEWDYQPWDGQAFMDENVPFSCDPLSQLLIPAFSTYKAQFAITPRKGGKFVASGISYWLGQPSSDGKVDDRANILNYQALRIVGERLNNTKMERAGHIYDTDRRLDLHVYDVLPKVSVEVSGFPISLLCNQLVSATLFIKNIGDLPLDVLKVIACDAVQFTIFDYNGIEFNVPSVTLSGSQNTGKVRIAPIKTLLQKPLNPGEKMGFKLRVKAPSYPGNYKAGLLLFAKSSPQAFPCYRTQFVEKELHCMEGIETNIHLVTPISQRTFVVAISIKNVAKAMVNQLLLEDITCMNANCKIAFLKHQSPVCLPPNSNVMTYFLASVSSDLTRTQCYATGEDGSDALFRIVAHWSFRIQEALIRSRDLFKVNYSFSNFGILSSRVQLEESGNEKNDLSLQTLHHLVSWKLAYNPRCSHKFTHGRLFYVRLTLVIFNLSDQQLDVRITLPELGTKPTLKSPFGFSWVGSTEAKQVVPVNGTVNALLMASFSKAGVYSLCGVGVTAVPTCLAGSKVPIPQKPLCGFFIDVRDC